MNSSGLPPPGQATNRFHRITGLAIEALDLANAISADSQAFLDCLAAPIGGTELEESWPLAFNLSVHRRIQERFDEEQRARFHGESLQINAQPYSVFQLAYPGQIIQDAYGARHSRSLFARDLIGWAGHMAGRSWQLLVDIDVRPPKVRVGIYEDDAAGRRLFAQRVTESQTPTVYSAPVAYAWCSDRVIVGGHKTIVNALARS